MEVSIKVVVGCRSELKGPKFTSFAVAALTILDLLIEAFCAGRFWLSYHLNNAGYKRVYRVKTPPQSGL